MLEWATQKLITGSRREQSEEVRKLLDQLVGFHCIVEHDDNGAPYIADHPELNISISHCREAVAVAVSDEGAVGIDIEGRRRINKSLILRVCTADEANEINASDDPEMLFLKYWTRKEAVLKCRRTGIKGFGSMVDASTAGDCRVIPVDTDINDVVATLATASELSENHRR